MEIRYSYHTSEIHWLDVWKAQHIVSPDQQITNHKSQITNSSPFVMVIPPPNITGSLHIGHALNNILQDFFFRFNLMRGKTALWVPGTDHGGIATQYVVERNLKAQGIDRTKVPRNEFEAIFKEWAQKTKTGILDQLVAMGCLLDFSRSRFTMDEVCSKSVFHAFRELYGAGLIYKGDRLISWCIRCRSALSDLELEWKQETSKLWQLRYPIIGGGSIVVATTRPETMLGDAAVAVHPEDDRYKSVVGKKIVLPLMNREISIIADHRVDMTFGTGAVKVTPGHDPLDWAIGQDHGLPVLNVIGENGLMTTEAGSYSGLAIVKAREKVLEDLQAQGIVIKEEAYPHNVGICYRCSSVVEPLVSKQWFLKMESLRDLALEAHQKRAEPKFYPGHWGEIYSKWLSGLKDWCLSRQIIWGHRIPVWYCKEGGELKSTCLPIVSQTKPERCLTCNNRDFEQDPDVLDTWFSSALWPMSVLGWPEETADFKRFYPTSLLVTGYDITYIWVARMVMMGLYFTGKVPFERVYLHGLVRDTQGRKMSKTLGNGIDPEEIQKEHSTDALRFTLLHAAQPGKDIPLAKDAFIGAKNFTTKLWNAARFIKLEMEKVGGNEKEQTGALDVAPEHPSDYWILGKLNETIEVATKAIENYDSAQALRKIYETFWGDFCDWYIEIAKLRLNQDQNERSLRIALFALKQYLKLLQPAIPFVTHEIYQEITGDPNELLARQNWPVVLGNERLSQGNLVVASRWWQVFSGIVTEIRILRADLGVSIKDILDVSIREMKPEVLAILKKDALLIEHLAKCKIVDVASNPGPEAQGPPSPGGTRGIFSVKRPLLAGQAEIVAYLSQDIKLEDEIKKLTKELEEAKKSKARLEATLSREDFLSKASPEAQAKEKERLSQTQQKIEKLSDYLKQLVSL